MPQAALNRSSSRAGTGPTAPTLAINASCMAADAAELVRLARALRADASRMVDSVRQATDALEKVDLQRLMGAAHAFATIAAGRPVITA